MDSPDPLRTAVEDLFRNSGLFVVPNKASQAIGISAPKAEAIPIVLGALPVRMDFY